MCELRDGAVAGLLGDFHRRHVERFREGDAQSDRSEPRRLVKIDRLIGLAGEEKRLGLVLKDA